MTKKINVTQPCLPPLEEFIPYLEKIWDSKWLTNNGPLHQQLEKELADYLGVKYISLFSNGTLALISALQALNIQGEVITTPFSFVATSHSLWWNKITPVFVDIEPEYLNLDPNKIEAAITPRTTAIMPVHVYGNPCQVDKIQKIADKHNLKVIYDAAHAFGVEKNGISILNYGDLSILSFHATKVYSTIEGGAIVCHSDEMKHHLDNLKNFGFRGETVVEEPGINAKMNEVQAAYGLLQLKYVDGFIERRKEITEQYRALLNDIPGIRFLNDMADVKHGYSYLPILVDEAKYGMSRDNLYEKLKEHNIFSRRYFYPLISDFEPYRELSSAKAENLPIATQIASKVICLPIYKDLGLDEVSKIVELIKIRGI
ncbi:dTDP-4-amino-4,6-dideoxygalactose transaminase [Dysgonomonas sp. PH5-45]|uniref:DegT/DnrJ/EryC1/StrS family aminotransferase n=1 Tax=unclassified Dysgonomonas TaxID=2630389 RepID=UPI002474C93F|nr:MULTISPECIES: DegT/DnrJ/EryC1/StrS family aminotransferase [unclassified Dysgonomonas]MDH6355290.1 dTDP-4-amino-4,6-dideoxygalactose transaminase [Dysgonomonas sp. PH5-45]MDH6388184.1 dTDP-4-amino-4,6-dideoxygalactose transaminase [Dysgonomonas sp. PH5-37]